MVSQCYSKYKGTTQNTSVGRDVTLCGAGSESRNSVRSSKFVSNSMVFCNCLRYSGNCVPPVTITASAFRPYCVHGFLKVLKINSDCLPNSTLILCTEGCVGARQNSPSSCLETAYLSLCPRILILTPQGACSPPPG
jgi:hypothetical protein